MEEIYRSLMFVLDGEVFYRKVYETKIIIKNNYDFLIETTKADDRFIKELESSNCLTKEEIQLISKLLKEKDRSSEILQFLRPYDEEKYDNFISCLFNTGQLRQANVLRHGGG